MAKRKTGGRKTASRKAGKRQRKPRSAKRPSPRRRAAKPKAPSRSKKPARATKVARKQRARKPAPLIPVRSSPARLSRDRRILTDNVPTPPSSLDMVRHGSAVRTGRAGMAEATAKTANLTPDIKAGDLDVNVEDAYFVGDEAPGGDNPTPDQEVVDEIGKALGVEYQDAEELRGSDKVADRDKHRWELDPASSEDYKNRK